MYQKETGYIPVSVGTTTHISPARQGKAAVQRASLRRTQHARPVQLAFPHAAHLNVDSSRDSMMMGSLQRINRMVKRPYNYILNNCGI
eukprot:6203269-Pleurochrysis_carterae.AAC.3